MKVNSTRSQAPILVIHPRAQHWAFCFFTEMGLSGKVKSGNLQVLPVAMVGFEDTIPDIFDHPRIPFAQDL